MTQLIIAFNCGSSSIKFKIFTEDLKAVASGGTSNIGEEPEIKVFSADESVKVNEKIDKELDYNEIFKALLEKVFQSLKLEKSSINCTAHRIVHGGDMDKPVVVTHDHPDKLKDIDRISAFAPLHNHAALNAVHAALENLPKSPAVLVFDTLFHQSLPHAVKTYAIGKSDHEPRIPLRKYGAHGLSYASILRNIANKLNKPVEKTSILVAHLGSGGSACAIKNGKSIDTTMGLTPLEGLPGGSRTGSIDPTLIFHHTHQPADVIDIKGMKVTKGEFVMNKKGGFIGLVGTSNFGKILDEVPPSNHECWSPAYDGQMPNDYALAYALYLDRLVMVLSGYLSKLTYGHSNPKDGIDAVVFSGGIGEKSTRLRKDVVYRLNAFNISIDDKLNDEAQNKEDEGAFNLSNDVRNVPAYVCWTDEENEAARQAKQTLSI